MRVAVSLGWIQPSEEHGCRCGAQQFHNDEPWSIVGSNSRECVGESSRYGNAGLANDVEPVNQ
jgi:hypothetical protein